MAGTTVTGDPHKKIGRMDGLPIVSVFRLTVEGSFKASELVRRGKYDLVNDGITNKRFPIQAHAPLDRTVELFEFDHNTSDEEVLWELKRRGLERPTYEDLLYFGIQYPEEQRKRPIVFFHEPVRAPGDLLGVLVLDGSTGYRMLSLDLFGSRCMCIHVFAGIRK